MKGKTKFWTDETKINLYSTDGKRKVWRKKGTAHDPKYTTPSVNMVEAVFFNSNTVFAMPDK